MKKLAPIIRFLTFGTLTFFTFYYELSWIISIFVIIVYVYLESILRANKNILKAIEHILGMHKTQLIIINQMIKDINEIYKEKHGEYLLKNDDFKYKEDVDS